MWTMSQRPDPNRSITACAVFVVATVAMPPAWPAQDTEIVTSQVADSVYLLRGGPGGNILVSFGDDGAFLVDAQSGHLADRVAEAIGGVTDRPVRMVVNTHYHEDHIGGNARLRQGGAITLATATSRRARLWTRP